MTSGAAPRGSSSKAIGPLPETPPAISSTRISGSAFDEQPDPSSILVSPRRHPGLPAQCGWGPGSVPDRSQPPLHPGQSRDEPTPREGGDGAPGSPGRGPAPDLAGPRVPPDGAYQAPAQHRAGEV